MTSKVKHDLVGHVLTEEVLLHCYNFGSKRSTVSVWRISWTSYLMKCDLIARYMVRF